MPAIRTSTVQTTATAHNALAGIRQEQIKRIIPTSRHRKQHTTGADLRVH